MGQSQAAVWEAVVKLVAANQRPEGAARVSFIKNHGGLWSDAPGSPATDLLIFTRELSAWPAAHELALVPDAIYSHGNLADAKMLSWVQNAGTLERVHKVGFDDALLLNEQGFLRNAPRPTSFWWAPAGSLPRLCIPAACRESLARSSSTSSPQRDTSFRNRTCVLTTWAPRRKSLSARRPAKSPAWAASPPSGVLPRRAKSHFNWRRRSEPTLRRTCSTVRRQREAQLRHSFMVGF